MSEIEVNSLGNNMLQCDEVLFNKSLQSDGSPSAALICNESFNLDQEMEIFTETQPLVLAFVSQSPEGLIEHLKEKEKAYHPSYNLLKYPPNIAKPYIRAILINEMQHVSAQFGFTRECFHTSINLIDRIISIDTSITIENFQLYGIVALYLANEIIDNIGARPSFLLQTAKNQYSIKDFRNLMFKFCNLLKWHMTPVTRFDVLIFCLREWDEYVKKNYLSIAENNAKLGTVAGLNIEQSVDYWMITFLNNSEFSVIRVLKIFSILDICALHIESYIYKPSLFVAGLIFVVFSYLIEKSGFGMLGFNIKVHYGDDEVVSMHREFCSNMVFQYLSTVFGVKFMGKVDRIEKVAKIVELFIECPDPDLEVNQYFKFDAVEKIHRQVFNEFPLNWIPHNKLK